MYIKSSLRKEKGITRKIKKLLSMLSFYRKKEVTSLYTTIIPPTEETNDHNYNQCGGKTLVFPFAPFHPIFYYTKIIFLSRSLWSEDTLTLWFLLTKAILKCANYFGRTRSHHKGLIASVLQHHNTFT